jgi:hypothetical protein
MLYVYSRIDNIEQLYGKKTVDKLRDQADYFGSFFFHAMFVPSGPTFRDDESTANAIELSVKAIAQTCSKTKMAIRKASIIYGPDQLHPLIELRKSKGLVSLTHYIANELLKGSVSPLMTSLPANQIYNIWILPSEFPPEQEAFLKQMISDMDTTSPLYLSSISAVSAHGQDRRELFHYSFQNV